MRLRRIAGAAAALAVIAGGGLLLSSPTPRRRPPMPIDLEATGMSSSSCPLPLNGSIAVAPNTAVQFKPGTQCLATGESLTITPAAQLHRPEQPTPKTSRCRAPATTPIAFTRPPPTA